MATLPTYDSGGDDGTGFAGRFPELATTVTADRTWITGRLAWWWTRHPASVWGTERAEATLLRAAVDWDVRQSKAAQGAAGARRPTQKSVGDWGRSHEGSSVINPNSSRYLMLSPEYGLAYIELREAVVAPPGII